MSEHTNPPTIEVTILQSGYLEPLTRQEKKLARRCSLCREIVVMNDPMQHVYEKHPTPVGGNHS